MVFNITFNNIPAILKLSGLLKEETGVSGENNQPIASDIWCITDLSEVTTQRQSQVGLV